MKLFELHDANENEDFNEKQFEKDCAFYLKTMGKKANSLFMLRGTSSEKPLHIITKFRPRKKPVSSPTKIHKGLNDFFEEKFGHPYRSGLFVSGESTTADQYGRTRIVVPVGKFEWLCNPDFVDIYGSYLDAENEHGNKGAIQTVLKDAMTSKKWKHNKDLPGCIESGAEIMLWCPNGYYLFHEDGRGDFLPRSML